jgi:3-methyladenine DNA glycosylase/8-oxoguanine DNA glycosylase
VGSRLTIRVPGDFVLSRDVCSYGYFLLAPNRWDVRRQVLSRVLHLPEGPARVTIAQPTRPAPARRSGVWFPHEPGAPLAAGFDRALRRSEHHEARRQIGRMLRLDEDEAHTRAFHRLDPRWRAAGRSRLFRSPMLFEYVVKTVTSCNVAWPSTVHMNQRLCEVAGVGGAFPTAARLARTRPGTLRARCRVGYRDRRLVELAGMMRDRGRRGPEVDEAWLTDPATGDDEVFAFLKSLPGIGPYAAGNIMQLLGRYSRLALDSESLRHGRAVLGMSGTDAQVLGRLAAHYEPFGPFRFKSYWFELWAFYEQKRGASHNWDRDEVGKSFTASQF